MIRNFLATTALGAVMATAAWAQNATPPAAVVPPATQAAPGATERLLATSLIGKTVYTGNDEEGEAIGEVSDIVLNGSGGAEALVIGVGGFLGVGEKDVAINFDRMSLSNRDGKQIIVVSATKKDLEAAPAFERKPVMDGAVSTAPAAPATTGAPVASPVITDENAETEIPMTGTTPQMTDPDAVPPQADTTTAGANPEPELQPVDPSLLSTQKLIGTDVKVADDTKIGKIGDVILDKNGKLEAYIIDVGGFLGVGAKAVAMSAKSVQIVADAKGNTTIYSPFTKEQLEKQPAYDAAAYKANPSGQLLTNP